MLQAMCRLAWVGLTSGIVMKRIVILAAGCGLLVCASVSFAFEEQKMQPAGGASAPTSGASAGGLSLADPGVALPRTSAGTKIRVPGLGVIGEIPKMDFGLELLYGASQPGQGDSDRNDGTGVMGRVTVPLKSR